MNKVYVIIIRDEIQIETNTHVYETTLRWRVLRRNFGCTSTNGNWILCRIIRSVRVDFNKRPFSRESLFSNEVFCAEKSRSCMWWLLFDSTSAHGIFICLVTPRTILHADENPARFPYFLTIDSPFIKCVNASGATKPLDEKLYIYDDSNELLAANASHRWCNAFAFTCIYLHLLAAKKFHFAPAFRNFGYLCRPWNVSAYFRKHKIVHFKIESGRLDDSIIFRAFFHIGRIKSKDKIQKKKKRYEKIWYMIKPVRVRCWSRSKRIAIC